MGIIFPVTVYSLYLIAHFLGSWLSLLAVIIIAAVMVVMSTSRFLKDAESTRICILLLDCILKNCVARTQKGMYCLQKINYSVQSFTRLLNLSVSYFSFMRSVFVEPGATLPCTTTKADHLERTSSIP